MRCKRSLKLENAIKTDVCDSVTASGRMRIAIYRRKLQLDGLFCNFWQWDATLSLWQGNCLRLRCLATTWITVATSLPPPAATHSLRLGCFGQAPSKVCHRPKQRSRLTVQNHCLRPHRSAGRDSTDPKASRMSRLCVQSTPGNGIDHRCTPRAPVAQLDRAAHS